MKMKINNKIEKKLSPLFVNLTVGFLGVVIRLEGIKMEEEKVKGVLDWPTLKGVKDVQKFLGLANYYLQFIKDFVAIARLLHNMVKKDQEWKWTERQERVFKELKERFTKEPVLENEEPNRGTSKKAKVK